MNLSNKLFIAALLLAIGYGLASLLGSPQSPYISQESARNPPAVFGPTPAVATRRQTAADEQVVGGIRLLPDFSAVDSSAQFRAIGPAPATGRAPATVAPAFEAPANATAPTLAPPDLAKVADESPRPAVLPAFPANAPSDAPSAQQPTLRAKLNDEAPRPLWIRGSAEPLPPLTAPKSVANAGSGDMDRAKDREVPVSYPKTENDKIGRPGEVSSAFNMHGSQAALFQQVTSPPPPREEVPLRTHIVVDGDSLQKLAKRYLSDPQRSDEIFAANRGLLTSPDLLPIGAELKIPASVKATGRGE